MDNQSTPTIRDLYPELDENDLATAEENLEQYFCLVLRIFERLESDVDSADQLTSGTGTLSCTPPEEAHQ